MRKFPKPSKINISLERAQRLMSPQGLINQKFEPPKQELPEMITAAVTKKSESFKSKLNKSKQLKQLQLS